MIRIEIGISLGLRGLGLRGLICLQCIHQRTTVEKGGLLMIRIEIGISLGLGLGLG